MIKKNSYIDKLRIDNTVVEEPYRVADHCATSVLHCMEIFVNSSTVKNLLPSFWILLTFVNVFFFFLAIESFLYNKSAGNDGVTADLYKTFAEHISFLQKHLKKI